MTMDEEKRDFTHHDGAHRSPSINTSQSEDALVSNDERALLRKLDGRILPITCLMYLFACTL